MKQYIEDRVRSISHYIVLTKNTVRQAAAHYKVSKSTVHKDVTVRIKELDPALAKAVDSVLQENKAERHIRGGLAFKKKYLH